jgi:hypothetical protein
MEQKKFSTFEEAWQKLFEALPPHERLEILSNPKGPRAAQHAKDALVSSGEISEAEKEEFFRRRTGKRSS